MTVLRKKPRLPRVNRTRESGLGRAVMAGVDENASLWVVSYADLLTVLLCFFVIFFSQGKESRESVIHKILLSQMNSKGESVEKREKTSEPNKASISQFRDLLKGLAVTSVQEGEGLVLLFPDDLYPKGEATLSAQYVATLKDLLSRLKPYEKQIDLVFIGHTDPTPVSHHRQRWIEDNFDLSTARAKKALKLAETFGFPLDHMRTEGDGAFKRASRTLSIAIQGRQEVGK